MHEKYSDWKPNFLCISICYVEGVWVCICTIFQASAHRKSETKIIKSIGKRLMPDLSFRIFYKKKLDWEEHLRPHPLHSKLTTLILKNKLNLEIVVWCNPVKNISIGILLSDYKGGISHVIDVSSSLSQKPEGLLHVENESHVQNLQRREKIYLGYFSVHWFYFFKQCSV